jgi:hypothetical protein
MDDPVGCLWIWPLPRGSLGQWLLALGTLAVLLAGFYLLFTALGY